jgi:hypothetical protein
MTVQDLTKETSMFRALLGICKAHAIFVVSEKKNQAFFTLFLLSKLHCLPGMQLLMMTTNAIGNYGGLVLEFS